MLTREYHFAASEGTTVAQLTDDYRFVGIQPTQMGDAVYLVVARKEHPDDGAVERTRIHFTPNELDDVIADLQRARSGCFMGEWPRPAYEYPEITSFTPIEGPPPMKTVGSVIEWLDENFSYQDPMYAVAELDTADGTGILISIG